MTDRQIALRNVVLSFLIAGCAIGVLFLVHDPDRAWQLSLAITGSIATLWVRSGRTPAPDLPQAVPLAEDLYRAYVAVYPVGTPRTLDGAHPDVRHGWLAVAEHVVQRIAERRLPPVPELPRPSTPAVVGTIGALTLVLLAACATLLSQGTEALELHHQAALLQDELLGQVPTADMGPIERAAVVDRYTADLVPCLDGAAHAHQLLLRAQKARGKAARDRQLEQHAQAALAQARVVCAAGMARAQALRAHRDLSATADLGVPRG